MNLFTYLLFIHLSIQSLIHSYFLLINYLLIYCPIYLQIN
jgi:hypothetical protein